ncbi:MAG: hypothetical protein HY574_09485 [candidate division NC10 bacterium]|nr:hypothetical protein [candidate division NC10 bacterium]
MSMVTRTGKVRGILLAAAGMIVTACTSFPTWRDAAYRDLLAGRPHLDSSQISPGGPPSSYLDFYDAGGRRLGYGIVRDGAVDLYGADGSRLGYGRR